jgi:hypothetical protein
MIRPLRDVHLGIFRVLGIVLPVLLVLAVAWRDPVRINSPTAPPGELIKTYPKLLSRYDLEVELRRAGQKNWLVLRGNILEPDVLLYVMEPDDSLSSARPLGRFRSGEALELPADTPATIKLTLYSGARQQVLDAAVLETGR